jgi:hypothetical protein
VAQAIECVAHRGLAQSDAAARARDTAILHHRIEDNEEIEIECTPIHDDHLRLARLRWAIAAPAPRDAVLRARSPTSIRFTHVSV